jgi:hypothetical protein
VYLQLILPIALVLALLAACFAGLFWRLASRFDARQCTAEWLDNFTLDSYAPMARLLDKADFEFLASQAGYRREITTHLMGERRKIFAAYLGYLVGDFNQLIGIGKLMIVYSSQDRQEFARRLWWQQMRFYVGICAVRVELALAPVGWTGTGADRLVGALTAMRKQIETLASPAAEINWLSS